MKIDLFLPTNSLPAYIARLSTYSLTLALLAITKTPIQQQIKPLAGLGMTASSSVALVAIKRNRDRESIQKLETDMRLGIEADRLTAIETLESEKIRERLTIELQNSNARVAEFGIDDR
ncbi:MAG: hypothetical protein SXA11_06615 [Cyanobacteriota bacterium]|nr:hypothetical protein [Cyanobacteriota bacterium]